jgi:hypothetical protein
MADVALATGNLISNEPFTTLLSDPNANTTTAAFDWLAL